MKAMYQCLLLTIGALAIAATGYAQVPSTNDMSDGNNNTGLGTLAIGGPAASNSGFQNTAVGFRALYANTTGGDYNTAIGSIALISNTTGNSNTAAGQGALYANSISNGNSAFGVEALFYNTASFNTAVGYGALLYNESGAENTATGDRALYSSTTGSNNTAFGAQALFDNSTGTGNAAQGYLALFSNTTGNRNLGLGNNALANNRTGSYNIGLGFQGGLNLTTGTDNIDIANVGVAGESHTLRLGTQGSSGVPGSGIVSTYIAGITSTTVTGSAVYVTSSGQLGVLASSERYKTDITPLGTSMDKLQQLRPVSFRLKTDPTGSLQYGLIAEEVAKVYPELVIRSADGRINGVRYEELTPILLNELQKQAAEIHDLKRQQKHFVEQAAQLRDVLRQLADLHAALVKLQSGDEPVARR